MSLRVLVGATLIASCITAAQNPQADPNTPSAKISFNLNGKWSYTLDAHGNPDNVAHFTLEQTQDGIKLILINPGGVADGQTVYEGRFADAHTLIGKSLTPQGPSKQLVWIEEKVIVKDADHLLFTRNNTLVYRVPANKIESQSQGGAGSMPQTGSNPLPGSAAQSGVGPGDARVIRIGDRYSVEVTNHSRVPMSAYSVVLAFLNSRQTLRHYYDARMVDRPPIQPGSSIQDPHPGVLVGAQLAAAVFTDGSSFGDATHVSDLMERRRLKLKSLVDVASVVCEAQRNGSNVQTAIDSLEQRKRSAQNTQNAMLNTLATEPYNNAIGKLKDGGSQGAAAFTAIVAWLQQVGAPLLEDPVRDQTGQPFIQNNAGQLSCSGGVS